jgi:D-3-phosphoglycerate dehydrogenase
MPRELIDLHIHVGGAVAPHVLWSIAHQQGFKLPFKDYWEFKDAIVALKNVYGTHHVGASTDQAQDAIAAETVRIIKSYKDTGKVPNVVNLAKHTPATHMLVVRHRDRPGVLAHVFDHLRSGEINVQETENIIFEGAQAAVARINLDGAPSAALLKQIQDGNSDILDLHLVTI